MSTPLPLPGSGPALHFSPRCRPRPPGSIYAGIDWTTIGDPAADPTPAQNINEMWMMCLLHGPRGFEHEPDPPITR